MDGGPSMKMSIEQAEALFGNLLDDRYDSVDRVVLWTYLQIGKALAGFRTFWRRWMGSDSGLNDTRLMRVARRPLAGFERGSSVGRAGG